MQNHPNQIYFFKSNFCIIFQSMRSY